MKLSLYAVVSCVLLNSFAVLGQNNLPIGLKPESVAFPPLAKQARIQGDVVLRSGTAGVAVISGHPLLAQAAVSSLKGIEISGEDIEATYHFILVDNTEIQVTERTEKRGNRFERLILHALMQKTERVVEYRDCVQKPVQLKNRIDFTENRLEIWIYGSIPCLQTNTSQIARY